MSTFGNLLQKERAARRLGLREAARQIGISAAYLSEIEKGHRDSFRDERGRGTALKLGAFYGIRPAEVMRMVGASEAVVRMMESSGNGQRCADLERACRFAVRILLETDAGERTEADALVAVRMTLCFALGNLDLGQIEQVFALRAQPPADDRTPADRAAEEECQRAALAAQAYADHLEREADHSCAACEEPAAEVTP